MTVKIWYEDLNGFISDYYAIIPNGRMTIEQKLNTLFRFFLYLGIILALIRADYRYLFFGLIAGFISVIIYVFEQRQRTVTEKFLHEKQLDIVNNEICSRSTLENPFMNPNIVDISENPSHPKACDITNDKVQQQVNRNYYARMFRDAGDLYDSESSQRQFYSMPVTTIVNDQTGFAEWLYKPKTTCKEASENCKGFF